MGVVVPRAPLVKIFRNHHWDDDEKSSHYFKIYIMLSFYLYSSQVYWKLTNLLADYPDLIEMFVGFLEPSQAKEVGQVSVTVIEPVFS